MGNTVSTSRKITGGSGTVYLNRPNVFDNEKITNPITLRRIMHACSIVGNKEQFDENLRMFILLDLANDLKKAGINIRTHTPTGKPLKMYEISEQIVNIIPDIPQVCFLTSKNKDNEQKAMRVLREFVSKYNRIYGANMITEHPLTRQPLNPRDICDQILQFVMMIRSMMWDQSSFITNKLQEGIDYVQAMRKRIETNYYEDLESLRAAIRDGSVINDYEDLTENLRLNYKNLSEQLNQQMKQAASSMSRLRGMPMKSDPITLVNNLRNLALEFNKNIAREQSMLGSRTDHTLYSDPTIQSTDNSTRIPIIEKEVYGGEYTPSSGVPSEIFKTCSNFVKSLKGVLSSKDFLKHGLMRKEVVAKLFIGYEFYKNLRVIMAVECGDPDENIDDENANRLPLLFKEYELIMILETMHRWLSEFMKGENRKNIDVINNDPRKLQASVLSALNLSLDNGSRAFTALAWELFCKYVNRIYEELKDDDKFSKYFIASNLTLGVDIVPDANNVSSIAVKPEFHVNKAVSDSINDVISTYHEELNRPNHNSLLDINPLDDNLPNTKVYRSPNGQVNDVLKNSDFANNDNGISCIDSTTGNTVTKKSILTDKYKIKKIEDLHRPAYDMISEEYNKVIKLNNDGLSNYIADIVDKIKKL